MQQQPGELDVVARRGLVDGGGLAFSRAGVAAPFGGEDDARQRLEIVGELDVAEPVLRVEHAGEDQVDHLLQAAAVRGRAGHLVERGQRLHHVHVHVQ